MKFQHYFLVLAMVTASVNARGQFREGFLITQESDTIYGEVFYRMNPSRYQVCRFRDESGVREFTPSELLGFGFLNDAFFSTRFVKDKFAEVLIQGRISMISIDNDLYIIKEGYDIFPVESSEEMIEGSHKFRITNPWKGTLIYWMSDCNSYFPDLDNTHGTVKELTQLIKGYHNCIDEIFTEYKSKKPWTRFEPGIYVGLGVTDVQIQESLNELNFMNSNYYTTTPGIGLNLTLSSPRLSELFALEINSGLNSTKIHSLVVREDQLATYYHESVFNVNTFTIGTYFRYTVYNGRLAYYFHGGVQYYNNSYDLIIYTEELRRNIVNRTEKSPWKDITKTGFVMSGGLSVMYKLPSFRLGAGLFYSPSLVINDMIIAPIDTYSVRFIISR